MNILITGARSYVAWSLLKLSQKQDNINVFIGDSQKNSICFQSDFFKEKFIFPSPRYDFYNFKICILEYIKEKRINIIFTTCEEIFYFSMIKEDIESIGVTIFCDDFSKLKLLHSKFYFNKYINNFDIKIPKTYIINKIEDLSKYNLISKAYIFKYEYSRFADRIYTNFKSNFKNINIIKKLDGKLLAQEFIFGKQICSFGIAKEGRLISNIVYENKLTYNGGSGTFICNIFNKKINSFVLKIVRELNFNGFISFDYMLSKNSIYVIECNPRVTSGIHLFDDNDILSDIIFKKSNYNNFYSNKKICKTFLFINIFFNLRSIIKYNNAFMFKNEIFNVDKKIFFYQLFLIIYYFIISIKTNKTISEISTDDIEYNG